MLAQVVENTFQMIKERKSCALGKCKGGNVLRLLPFLFGDFVFFSSTEFTQLFVYLVISWGIKKEAKHKHISAQMSTYQ